MYRPVPSLRRVDSKSEDWGQTESFLAFQQLDKFEGNIPSVPDFLSPISDFIGHMRHFSLAAGQ
jgi:hypothetical protein